MRLRLHFGFRFFGDFVGRFSDRTYLRYLPCVLFQGTLASSVSRLVRWMASGDKVGGRLKAPIVSASCIFVLCPVEVDDDDVGAT